MSGCAEPGVRCAAVGKSFLSRPVWGWKPAALEAPKAHFSKGFKT